MSLKFWLLEDNKQKPIYNEIKTQSNNIVIHTNTK